jgi:protease I
MKNIKLICIFVFAFFVVITPLFAQSEDIAIKKAVTDYLDGGTTGDVTRFKSAFVPDAVQRSVGKTGDVSGMSVQSLASKIKPGSVMSRTTRILSWSYANDAATAVTETIYPTSKIIDLLNLLKVNGGWKIVSRVFSRMELDEQVSSSSPSAPIVNAVKPVVKKKVVVSDDGW